MYGRGAEGYYQPLCDQSALASWQSRTNDDGKAGLVANVCD